MTASYIPQNNMSMANGSNAMSTGTPTIASPLMSLVNQPNKMASSNPIANITKTPLGASTTTISNANKIKQVPEIVNKTNQLADTGIKSDNNGGATYSNGTSAVEQEKPAPVQESGTTTSVGGYVGDVYYAPGSTIPVGDDGKPVPLNPTSTASDNIISNINNQKSQADSLTADILDTIKSQYQNLIGQQEEANRASKSSILTSLQMGGATGQGGSLRYAPISSQGIIDATVNYGIQKLADLTNKEKTALLDAKKAGQDGDYQLMEKLNSEISKVRDEKITATKVINDKLAAQNDKLKEEKIQQTKDNAIADLYSKGITTPAEIVKKLTDQGITVTADEVSKSLTAIKPTVDELNRQQAAIKFAVDNGVTKPFYLVGNTAIDTKTGKPVTLAEYQKATGQQVGLSEDKTDFSQIQHLMLPDVKKLADKYIDAGILPTDTLEQAQSKLKDSKIYQKETTLTKTQIGSGGGISSGVTTVGGNGIIAGIKVPENIAGDVLDVLEGRNTIMNIRLQMGRSTQAATYLKSLRDSIHKIDPKFDFVSSDAGAKFISSTYYQKSAAAIKSVLPNIDTIVNLSDKVSRIGLKAVDNLLQKGAVQIGDKKVSNFREAQKLIADEIGLALGQGSVSDMKLQLGFDVTDPSVSPEVFASNMQIVKEFVNNRMKGMEDMRYKSGVDVNTVPTTTLMTGPDGKQYNVPNNQVDAFIKVGGHK